MGSLNASLSIASEPQNPERVDLYLNMANQSHELAICVNKQIADRKLTPQDVDSLIVESGDFESLVEDSKTVLGDKSPSIAEALNDKLSKVTRIRVLLVRLGVFSWQTSDRDIEGKLLGVKANSIAYVHMALATNGICKPSQKLIKQMAEIPHANR